MDIIPEMGDWVCCQGRELGPGKVIMLNHNRSEFTAEFFGEPDLDGPSIAEETLSFIKIKSIINDPNEISNLEKEYAGK